MKKTLVFLLIGYIFISVYIIFLFPPHTGKEKKSALESADYIEGTRSDRIMLLEDPIGIRRCQGSAHQAGQ